LSTLYLIVFGGLFAFSTIFHVLFNWAGISWGHLGS